MKRELIKQIGFKPKEGTKNIFQKKYVLHDNYSIEIDFNKESFNYGKAIKCESKTTQNFSQEENWVVLECVNRLLEKGYKPQDIILEKVYPTGHGTSGRLDILVKKNKKAYLMIECKVWGKEFENEFKKMNSNGGQLFTYFQQDRDSEYLVLYASKIEGGKIHYRNEIINIEESYRETSNVKDLFDRWSKLTKKNGIFEDWIDAYDFRSKALTLSQLKPITQKDSSFIFNRFLEILRHNVVSDKPNAFNKMFTLFLCKIVDENREENEQLDFQWIQGEDNNISFQKRLADLYKRGMKEFLSKEVTDISDDEFNKKYGFLDEESREKILEEITKIRLQKNNEFAIKEVFDEHSFEENAKVLKEVVVLLQEYKIRYNKKQQYLSDFFELLLTTGLKQESGQFFTPVPIARFICRSIPLDKIIHKKLNEGDTKDLLPTMIDYATGSGHFLTESMDEVQQVINKLDENKLKPSSKKKVKGWKDAPYEWAYDYVYGIEKDYRLVKTAKVGCYLHGDGIAQVIHGDGLDSFKYSKEYKDKLKQTDSTFIQDNKQFDLVLSNPPYSVSAFRTNFKDRDIANQDFELFKNLTDQSSEIECLFIERTKQLLKEGGIAGIVLPSSILTNTGIYVKTREIILKYFEIIGIAEFGSGTFMATGTNTVTLFLRRRNDYEWKNIESSIEKFSTNLKDVTVNGIENAFSNYVKHSWKTLSFSDYISIFKKTPSKNVLEHELYKKYKKLKLGKNEKILEKIIELEKEKMLYYFLSFLQKVIIVKSGEKKIEKEFLGYEFSNRRGNEGIHSIQRGKNIDECTKLFDSKNYENYEKVSAYLYSGFEGNFENEISESLKDHVFREKLVDLISWDNSNFEKVISLNIKKKIEIKTKWDLVKLGDFIDFKPKSKRPASYGKESGKYPFYTSSKIQEKYVDDCDYKEESIIIGDGGNSSIFLDNRFSASDHNFVFKSSSENLVNKFIYYFYKNNFSLIEFGLKGQGLQNISKTYLQNLEIPLPPKKVQEKIVFELDSLEQKFTKKLEEQKKLRNDLAKKIENLKFSEKNLDELVDFKNGLNYDKKSEGEKISIVGVGDFKDNFSPDVEKLEKIQINGTLNDSYELMPNDILVVRSNGSANLVGRFLYITELKEKTSFSGFTIRLRRKTNNIDAKFLCHYLKSEKVRNKLVENSGGSNIKSLNQGLLSSIKVPLPSISEQKKIISELNQIESKIKKCEEELIGISKAEGEIISKNL